MTGDVDWLVWVDGEGRFGVFVWEEVGDLESARRRGGRGVGRRFSDGDNGVESEGHREDAIAFIVYVLADEIDSSGSSGVEIGWSAKLGLESLSDGVVSSLGIVQAYGKGVGVVNCFGF